MNQELPNIFAGFRKGRGMRAYTANIHCILENVGSQEIPGVRGKFDLGVQHEAEQRLTEFAKRTHH